MAAFQAQITYKDAHAAELRLPYSPATPYLSFNLEPYDYLEANALLDTSTSRLLQGLKRAKDKSKQLQLEQAVTDESEWAGIDSIYLPQLRRFNEKVIQIFRERQTQATGICDTPEGDPADYLEKIVGAHPGRVVLIDFWGTWCGPCVKGMEDMEPQKEELTAKGVDFVYITNESSHIDAWNEAVKKHAGGHYRMPREKEWAMQIPSLKESIPHYLIYDRKERLVHSQSGWRGTEALTEKLEEALRRE